MKREKVHDSLSLNYYALFLAITKKYSVEQAFLALKRGKVYKSKVTSEMVKKMLELRKQGKRFREIGKILGVSESTASKYVRMYEYSSNIRQ